MAASKRMTANVSQALERSYRFFRQHAGYVVGRSAEGAWDLAQAELEAASRGWYYEWQDDPEGWDSLGEIDPETVTEVLWVALYDEEGELLESLGSVVDPDRDYARVVEAELALEALHERGEM